MTAVLDASKKIVMLPRAALEDADTAGFSG